MSLLLSRKSLPKEAPEPCEGHQEKYTDLKYLSQRTKADPGLMTEMITLYLGQTSALIKEMMEAAKKSDWKGLHSIAHKLIPSFSIVGISARYEGVAKQLQEDTRTGEKEDDIHNSVLILHRVLGHACTELELELNHIKNKES